MEIVGSGTGERVGEARTDTGEGWPGWRQRGRCGARANANIKSNISRAVRAAAPLESRSRSPRFYLFLI